MELLENCGNTLQVQFLHWQAYLISHWIRAIFGFRPNWMQFHADDILCAPRQTESQITSLHLSTACTESSLSLSLSLIVLSRITDRVNNYLDPSQSRSRFRPKHSTSDVIHMEYDSWLAMISQWYERSFHFDMSQAFTPSTDRNYWESRKPS